MFPLNTWSINYWCETKISCALQNCLCQCGFVQQVYAVVFTACTLTVCDFSSCAINPEKVPCQAVTLNAQTWNYKDFNINLTPSTWHWVITSQFLTTNDFILFKTWNGLSLHHGMIQTDHNAVRWRSSGHNEEAREIMLSHVLKLILVNHRKGLPFEDLLKITVVRYNGVNFLSLNWLKTFCSYAFTPLFWYPSAAYCNRWVLSLSFSSLILLTHSEENVSIY